MPPKYSNQERLVALDALQKSAKISGDAPNWSACAQTLGIHKSTLKRWWRTYGGAAGVSAGVDTSREEEEAVLQKARQSAGSATEIRRSPRGLLEAAASDAHEALLGLALEAFDEAESDAGRVGALREVCRLVEAHGRRDEGAKWVTPGEWVLMARRCPQLLLEAVLGCPWVLERVGRERV